MKVGGIHWWPVRIPLKGVLSTAAVPRLAFREGVVIRLEASGGVVGVGEAMPFPRCQEMGLDRSLAALRRLAPPLERLPLEDAHGMLESQLAGCSGAHERAVCSGLDTALWDARSRGAGRRLADLLAGSARRRIPVNALIPGVDTEGATWGAARARDAGFRTVKLKVGGRSAKDEVRRVKAVRQVLGPGVRLRIDANGAWDPETAVEILETLMPFDPELVEQPVAADDLDGLVEVARRVSVPVAADEAVDSLESAERILSSEVIRMLVVKPTVVGGISQGRRIVDAALAKGASAFVTTNLDAGVGTAAALHLAATLPEEAPACGLATAGLLDHDLLSRNLRVDAGDMVLPAEPGLGVDLDPEAVKRYSVGPEESL